MIIEILSEKNQGHDVVIKFNLDMEYGVKEYWIVNPVTKAVIVYGLNSAGLYSQRDIKGETGRVHSSRFPNLVIDLEEIL